MNNPLTVKALADIHQAELRQAAEARRMARQATRGRPAGDTAGLLVLMAVVLLIWLLV